ncbi:MAG: ornithine cyclodeaminase family protein, partial [Phenylobacterium sp.]
LILLFDNATGRIDTVIEASRANALRTAAADAVAASVLARPEARTVAIFGTGQQAFCEVHALKAVRPIKQVFVVGRRPTGVDQLIEKLAAAGIRAAPATAEAACTAADIIVTATPSRAPLFEAEWVKPGTHIAAMGADGPGKQELPVELLRRAALFCDLPEQSVKLGEFQSVAQDVADGRITVTPIGRVLCAEHPGRASVDEITVFDSSGLALQDLALALRLTGRMNAK